MNPATHGMWCFFFFQAEDGIRDLTVTGVQTCALPISVCLPLLVRDCLGIHIQRALDGRVPEQLLLYLEIDVRRPQHFGIGVAERVPADLADAGAHGCRFELSPENALLPAGPARAVRKYPVLGPLVRDRKSTRLNSSHSQISYAVF